MSVLHSHPVVPRQRSDYDPAASSASELRSDADLDLQAATAVMDRVRDLTGGRGSDPHAWRLAAESLVAVGSRLVALRTHVLLPALAPYDGPVDRGMTRDLCASLGELHVALSGLFRRLRGDAYERRPVDALTARVDEALRLYAHVERQWLARFDALPVAVQSRVTTLLGAHRTLAPTRPHPYAPRRGLFGRFTFAIAGRWDRVLDRLDARPLPRAGRAPAHT